MKGKCFQDNTKKKKKANFRDKARGIILQQRRQQAIQNMFKVANGAGVKRKEKKEIRLIRS
jgi:hypothetical protein